MGGNWGTNVEPVAAPPAGYFDCLDRLGVDRLGISVALHVADSRDSTVERVYDGVEIPTFRDDDLVRAMRAARRRGLGVYLTLAIEDQEARAAPHPVSRWQLGVSGVPQDDPRVAPESWPWRPEASGHAAFVLAFWESYTRQAVHFGRMAQAEGVELFSLGTETDRLFRSRPGGVGPNDFGDELWALVHSLRQVYDGPLTYAMHFESLRARGLPVTARAPIISGRTSASTWSA